MTTPKRTESILTAFLGRRELFLRLNPLKGADIPARLTAEGLTVESTDVENCVSVTGTGNIAALDSFREGLFHVQDRSSQLCCRVLGAKPGETVVDCCAAPGGKSFTVAEYMGRIHSEVYQPDGRWNPGDQPAKPSGIQTLTVNGKTDI